MTTTTIRLPRELKERVSRAAARAGKTPHSFILDAIAEKAELEELRADFHQAAEERYAAIVASGRAIAWSEMRAYLRQRTAGTSAARPKARKLGR